MKLKFLLSISFFFLCLPPQSGFSKELFLRRESGFEVHAQSNWKIDADAAYLDAQNRLEAGKTLYGIDAETIIRSGLLQEQLETKERAYGRVYRMTFTGFIRDTAAKKIRETEVQQITSNRQSVLLKSLVGLIVVAASILLLVRMDRIQNGDRRLTLLATWFTCVPILLLLIFTSLL